MRWASLLLVATLIVSVGCVDEMSQNVDDLWDQQTYDSIIQGFVRTDSVHTAPESVSNYTENTDMCPIYPIPDEERRHALNANSTRLQICDEHLSRYREAQSRYRTVWWPELQKLRSGKSACQYELDDCNSTLGDCNFARDLYNFKWMPEKEANITNLTQRLAAANETLATLRGQLVTLSGQLATLRRENASHVAKKMNLTEQLEGANETVATLRRENALHVENSTKLAEQLAAANETLTNLTRENASHVATSTKLKEQLVAANETLATLGRDNALHVANIEKLKEQLLVESELFATYVGENAQLTKANAANVAKITKLENELAAARGQHEPKAELDWVEYVFKLMVSFALISIIVTANDSTHRLLNWFFIIPNFTSRTACGNAKLWQEAKHRGFVLFVFVIVWMVCCMSTKEFDWNEHLILVVLIDLGWLWWKLGAVHPGANTRVAICDERRNLVLYESTRSDKFLACFGQHTVRVSIFTSLLFNDLTVVYILFVLHVVLYVGKALYMRYWT
jgi:hypothetical protein